MTKEISCACHNSVTTLSDSLTADPFCKVFSLQGVLQLCCSAIVDLLEFSGHSNHVCCSLSMVPNL